jgi:hypothetical protein
MTVGLAYLAALTLAVVLTYSAVAKFRDSHAMRRAVRAAGLRGGGVIVKVVPVIEVITAASLLIRPSLGAKIALVLLTIFTLFVLHLLAHEIDVSCGCFGANATTSVSAVDVVRNAFLLTLAAVATKCDRPTGFALEELIAATTAIAIGVVVLAAIGTRRELGQLFDNQLPGER